MNIMNKKLHHEEYSLSVVSSITPETNPSPSPRLGTTNTMLTQGFEKYPTTNTESVNPHHLSALSSNSPLDGLSSSYPVDHHADTTAPEMSVFAETRTPSLSKTIISEETHSKLQYFFNDTNSNNINGENVHRGSSTRGRLKSIFYQNPQVQNMMYSANKGKGKESYDNENIKQSEKGESVNATINTPSRSFSLKFEARSSKDSIASKVATKSWPARRRKSSAGYSESLHSYLQPTSLGPVSSDTYSTLSPKTCHSSYSPSLHSVAYKKTFKRQKVIEELVTTEIAYIEFLKMLSETFTDIIEGSYIAKFLQIPSMQYINLSIVQHRKFLYEVQQLQTSASARTATTTSTLSLCINANSLEFPADHHSINFPMTGTIAKENTEINHSRPIIMLNSPMVASLVATLVADKAMCVHYYQEYFSLFGIVSKISETLDLKESYLKKGHKRFSEATQSLGEKMDLSFLSLLQKPASRLGKYRSLVESLLANMPDADEESTSMVISSLEKIKEKLNIINDYSNKTETNGGSKKLFSRLSFDPQLSFPVECFGVPLLCGSLAGVWRTEHKTFVSSFYGVFVFKSALILCDVEKHKYNVKFLIPLSCCKVEANDASEGLYCPYEKALKLIFEKNYALYEVMLLSFDKKEFHVWKTKLQILTEYANGPYAFDYSSSVQEHATSIIPPTIAPMDISLNRFNEVDYNFSFCYFAELISFRSRYIGAADGKPIKQKHFDVNTTFTSTIPEITFKKQDQLAVEKNLRDIWSEELKDKTEPKEVRKHVSHKSIRYISDSFRYRRSTGNIKEEACKECATINSNRDKFLHHSSSSLATSSSTTTTNTTTTGKVLMRKASNVFSAFINRKQ